jgi:hypothetical protein
MVYSTWTQWSDYRLVHPQPSLPTTKNLRYPGMGFTSGIVVYSTHKSCFPLFRSKKGISNVIQSGLGLHGRSRG